MEIEAGPWAEVAPAPALGGAQGIASPGELLADRDRGGGVCMQGRWLEAQDRCERCRVDHMRMSVHEDDNGGGYESRERSFRAVR